MFRNYFRFYDPTRSALCHWRPGGDTSPSTVYRVETHISIAYGTDVDQVREVMVEALRREDWVRKDRLVEALLLNITPQVEASGYQQNT